MEFHRLTPAHRPLVDKYMYRYGEGSCQHSFASMFCFNGKYGHFICEKDGWLFVRRDKLSDERYQAYLMPMGRGDPAEAVELLKADARERSALVKLETVTKNAGNLLEKSCPGVFEAEERRDYAEYIYLSEKLAGLAGPEMASKRHDVNIFRRNYADRVLIAEMTGSELDAVRAFQEGWLRKYSDDENEVQLEIENEAIMAGLENFSALGLSGILLYVDGILRGYAFGSKISDGCYDVMIEKGDREIEDIYRVLNMEIARRCCRGFRYINREEDLGVPGLRKSKLSYKPDFLLKKYVMKEKST